MHIYILKIVFIYINKIYIYVYICIHISGNELKIMIFQHCAPDLDFYVFMHMYILYIHIQIPFFLGTSANQFFIETFDSSNRSSFHANVYHWSNAYGVISHQKQAF